MNTTTDTDKLMTRQESENIDLAEKGMKSPLNPAQSGADVDLKDQKTVLENTRPERQEHPIQNHSAKN